LTAALVAVLLAGVLWIGWSERHPEQERDLRVLVQEQVEDTFPGQLQKYAERFGIFERTVGSENGQRLGIVLVHGLDEPGGIWDDLLPTLGSAGYATWEFRYPNDQGIDRSADLLAANWQGVPGDVPLVLIGHSMGGLVVRDFVTRWRHPVEGTPRVTGAPVRSVILAGTPNQGSELARMRVWLEPRDQLATGRQSGFSPLAGLADGTGAAKIDLQPGSRFLDDLNARPWPTSVQIRVIGGLLVQSAPGLGDGVVAVNSLAVVGASPPTLVAASHRGMLNRLLESDPEPPAIAAIMALLAAFDGDEVSGDAGDDDE